MNTTIRMTQREQDLTAASNAGRRAFHAHWDKALQYKVDPAISQAWDNGYRLAKEEQVRSEEYFNGERW